MLKSKITTIKLELEDGKEIYIMYEKPEAHKYICRIYSGVKKYGFIMNNWTVEFPIKEDDIFYGDIPFMNIRTDSDENFEKDICEFALNENEKGNLYWIKMFID